MWMDEEYTVEPSSPQKPYSYVAYSIQSCWEEDERDEDIPDFLEDEDVPVGAQMKTGNYKQCISQYGPNAGKPKPGVTADGKAMVSTQYALYTDERTVIMTRCAADMRKCAVDPYEQLGMHY